MREPRAGDQTGRGKERVNGQPAHTGTQTEGRLRPARGRSILSEYPLGKVVLTLPSDIRFNECPPNHG